MKILLPPTLLAALFAMPVAAQQLDRQPAAGSRPPPTRMEGDRASPPTAPAQPPVGTGTPRQEPARTEPPPGHTTLPAPAVPNQRQPESSEGAGQAGQSPIGPRPGARPDASTTRAQEGPAQPR
ncbi:hypothetical protein G3576_11255 [Roseomonas stagni]|uniref:Uncharacterized protein n=1 Tax=Falsiroseomonas algicola TaxID=2716930 RepID=A0A6M1LJS0_9PROT|nr:hypothetical protein [Falsiroseomonas algicola]NGM20595.1 hypothetical protein [Falsiroseomonas algicola]